MSFRGPTAWRRFLRWAGFSHEGPIRIRAKHWWEWRKANRAERFLNWRTKQPDYDDALKEAVLMSLLSGAAFTQAKPDGFVGLGIADLLADKEQS